jgi:hypothetical protein
VRLRRQVIPLGSIAGGGGLSKVVNGAGFTDGLLYVETDALLSMRVLVGPTPVLDANSAPMLFYTPSIATRIVFPLTANVLTSYFVIQNVGPGNLLQCYVELIKEIA